MKAKQTKKRADLLVFERGLAESRERAKALVMAGLVRSGGREVEKPGEMLDPLAPIEVLRPLPYVSRGGLKLEEALDAFAVNCRGAVAADIGASTGGFTDCLLQRGARVVYAIDVSIRQLDWRLLQDDRVVPIEKNARYLSREDFLELPRVVTMDVSFISVLKILPAVREFLGDGILIALLKPQFEAGKQQVGKKGIVRDPALHEAILNKVLTGAEGLGFAARGLLKSSVPGQKGNREFFVLWTLREKSSSGKTVGQLIKEAVYGEKN